MDKRYTGVITSIELKKGHGWIKSSSPELENTNKGFIFLDKKDYKGFNVNTKVTFAVVVNAKLKLQATNLQMVTPKGELPLSQFTLPQQQPKQVVDPQQQPQQQDFHPQQQQQQYFNSQQQ